MSNPATVEEFYAATVPVENWNREPIPDDIIAAWEAGKLAGVDAERKAIQTAFNLNIKAAFEFSEKLYLYITNDTKSESTARLRATKLDAFEVVLTIHTDIYVNNDFRRAIHTKMLELENESRAKDIRLDFVLVPDSGHIDEDAMHSDGFLFRYSPK